MRTIAEKGRRGSLLKTMRKRLVRRRGRKDFPSPRPQFIRMLLVPVPVQLSRRVLLRVPLRRAVPRGRVDGIRNPGIGIAVAGAPENTNVFFFARALSGIIERHSLDVMWLDGKPLFIFWVDWCSRRPFHVISHLEIGWIGAHTAPFLCIV